MYTCIFLSNALYFLYFISVFSTLLLFSVRLHILLHTNRTTLTLVGCVFILAAGGGLILLVGIGEKKAFPAPAQVLCAHQIETEYVAMGLCGILAYHVAMLTSVIFAIRENIQADKRHLGVQARYAIVLGGGSLYLEHPLTVEDRVLHLYVCQYDSV